MANIMVAYSKHSYKNSLFKRDLLKVGTFINDEKTYILIRLDETSTFLQPKELLVDVFDNGTKIFSGTKSEFFNKLKQ